METVSKYNTKTITTHAILIAMAFFVGSIFRIRGIFPAASFLTYDPKDVVILIGGFLFGPLSALVMSIIVALVEMVTISDSGLLGAAMNALSSAALTCTASVFYLRKRTMTSAIIGLIVGCVVVTCTMLLWNYFVIPIYQPFITREAVVKLILPALLPFNLLKAMLNSAITIVLYKRVVTALRASGLYKDSRIQE